MQVSGVWCDAWWSGVMQVCGVWCDAWWSGVMQVSGVWCGAWWSGVMQVSGVWCGACRSRRCATLRINIYLCYMHMRRDTQVHIATLVRRECSTQCSVC